MSGVRALMIGISAAILPVAFLSGCSGNSSAEALESEISSVEGVSGAWVKTTTSGSPTNRGYAIRLYLQQAPGAEVARIAEEAAEIAWRHDGFRPSNGVGLEMEVGERPENPRSTDIARLIDLRSEAADSGMDLLGRFGSSGLYLDISPRELEERFGPWGS